MQTENKKCCGNCVYFQRYYTRIVEDNDSLMFWKSSKGECFNGDDTTVNESDICDKFMEYEPGLLERLVVSDIKKV